jgi:hypothetical protein
MRMTLPRVATAAAFLLASAPALADIDRLQTLSQQEFRLLAEDLGAALSYKPLQPIEPLGAGGFDIGVAVTGTRLKHKDLFERATGESDFPSTLPVPSLRASLGLPLNLDLSAMYGSVPKTGASLYGGALSWAAFGGNATLPALGVRASHTRLYGVDQLDFNASTLDASLSKGFGPFTPYAGAGKVWSKSTPKSTTGLRQESISQTKVFAGIGVKLGVVNFLVEYDRTGTANSYGAKLGLRF